MGGIRYKVTYTTIEEYNSELDRYVNQIEYTETLKEAIEFTRQGYEGVIAVTPQYSDESGDWIDGSETFQIRCQSGAFTGLEFLIEFDAD